MKFSDSQRTGAIVLTMEKITPSADSPYFDLANKSGVIDSTVWPALAEHRRNIAPANPLNVINIKYNGDRVKLYLEDNDKAKEIIYAYQKEASYITSDDRQEDFSSSGKGVVTIAGIEGIADGDYSIKSVGALADSSLVVIDGKEALSSIFYLDCNGSFVNSIDNSPNDSEWDTINVTYSTGGPNGASFFYVTEDSGWDWRAILLSSNNNSTFMTESLRLDNKEWSMQLQLDPSVVNQTAETSKEIWKRGQEWDQGYDSACKTKASTFAVAVNEGPTLSQIITDPVTGKRVILAGLWNQSKVGLMDIGTMQWIRTFTVGASPINPIYYNGFIYVACAGPGLIYKVNITTGVTISAAPSVTPTPYINTFDSGEGGLFLVDGIIYSANANINVVSKIDPTNLAILGEVTMSTIAGPTNMKPIYITDGGNGYLYVIGATATSTIDRINKTTFVRDVSFTGAVTLGGRTNPQCAVNIGTEIWFSEYSVNKVSCFNISTGAITFSTTTQPFNAVRYMAYCAEDDIVYAMNRSTNGIARIKASKKFLSYGPGSIYQGTWAAQKTLLYDDITKLLFFTNTDHSTYSYVLKAPGRSVMPVYIGTPAQQDFVAATPVANGKYVAESADGDIWFSDSGGTERIFRVDGTTWALKATITLPTTDDVTDIQYNPIDGFIYVISNASIGWLYKINPADNTFTTYKGGVAAFYGISIDSDGIVWLMAYNSLYRFDSATNKMDLWPWKLTGSVTMYYTKPMVISPTRRELYVVNPADTCINIIDLENKCEKERIYSDGYQVWNYLQSPVITSDEKYLYVCGLGADDWAVIKIDLDTRKVVKYINVHQNASTQYDAFLTISNDDRYLYFVARTASYTRDLIVIKDDEVFTDMRLDTTVSSFAFMSIGKYSGNLYIGSLDTWGYGIIDNLADFHSNFECGLYYCNNTQLPGKYYTWHDRNGAIRMDVDKYYDTAANWQWICVQRTNEGFIEIYLSDVLGGVYDTMKLIGKREHGANAFFINGVTDGRHMSFAEWSNYGSNRIYFNKIMFKEGLIYSDVKPKTAISVNGKHNPYIEIEVNPGTDLTRDVHIDFDRLATTAIGTKSDNYLTGNVIKPASKGGTSTATAKTIWTDDSSIYLAAAALTTTKPNIYDLSGDFDLSFSFYPTVNNVQQGLFNLGFGGFSKKKGIAKSDTYHFAQLNRGWAYGAGLYYNNGKVATFGGYNGTDYYQYITFFDMFEKYTTDLQPRAYNTAVDPQAIGMHAGSSSPILYAGKYYFFGTYAGSNQIFVFDPANEILKRQSDIYGNPSLVLPFATYNYHAVMKGSVVYIINGAGLICKYDLSTPTVLPVSLTAAGVGFHSRSLCFLHNNIIYINQITSTTMKKFDTISQTWIANSVNATPWQTGELGMLTHEYPSGKHLQRDGKMYVPGGLHSGAYVGNKCMVVDFGGGEPTYSDLGKTYHKSFIAQTEVPIKKYDGIMVPGCYSDSQASYRDEVIWWSFDNNTYLAAELNTSNQLVIYFDYDTAEAPLTININVKKYKWNDLRITRNGTTGLLKVFLNEIEVGSRVIPSLPKPTTRDIHLEVGCLDGEFFTGYVGSFTLDKVSRPNPKPYQARGTATVKPFAIKNSNDALHYQIRDMNLSSSIVPGFREGVDDKDIITGSLHNRSVNAGVKAYMYGKEYVE